MESPPINLQPSVAIKCRWFIFGSPNFPGHSMISFTIVRLVVLGEHPPVYYVLSSWYLIFAGALTVLSLMVLGLSADLLGNNGYVSYSDIFQDSSLYNPYLPPQDNGFRILSTDAAATAVAASVITLVVVVPLWVVQCTSICPLLWPWTAWFSPAWRERRNGRNSSLWYGLPRYWY